MTDLRCQGIVAAAIVSAFAPVAASAQGRPRAEQVAAIDSIAQAPIKTGRAAGMSVAVVRGADTIVLRGYGHADLELDVPTPAGAVYEIGSVTKQFTAAAIFQLAERKALSLDDEITKHLPTYPTQGHRITIRRLLNHTSGIKGYTELPRFWTAIAMRDLHRDSLVEFFAKEPFDFAPGEMMIYNNSAYFLLGLVIEKASGESYETYVKKHLFDPADMKASHYCTNDVIVKNRAKGYAFGQQGLQRAPYLSHVWPYSAGSLCSTAGDLVAWNRALHGSRGAGGSILPAHAYQEYLTPGTLNDGAQLRYAYGLAITETDGRRRISHGGGIYGYASEARYYPSEDLIIVVLINTAGGSNPSAIADGIENVVLGNAPAPPERRFAGDLNRFTGTYEGPGRGQAFTLTAAVDSGSLTFKVGNGRARPVRYVDGLTFAEGSGLFTFVEQGNEIVGLRADQVGGYLRLTRRSK